MHFFKLRRRLSPLRTYESYMRPHKRRAYNRTQPMRNEKRRIRKTMDLCIYNFQWSLFSNRQPFVIFNSSSLLITHTLLSSMWLCFNGIEQKNKCMCMCNVYVCVQLVHKKHKRIHPFFGHRLKNAQRIAGSSTSASVRLRTKKILEYSVHIPVSIPTCSNYILHPIYGNAANTWQLNERETRARATVYVCVCVCVWPSRQKIAILLRTCR